MNMKQVDEEGEGYIRKRIGFMTNPPEIAKGLAKICPASHRDIQLFNGRAAQAAIYPDDLCKELLKGLIR